MTQIKQSQAGFSLLELMVVVALIGILTAITLPSFASTSRRAKADSEVSTIFTELRVRQEQYALEHGRFLSTGTTEANLFPATPSTQGQALGTLPTTWTQLRVRVSESMVRCSYVMIAGAPVDAAGSMATGSFGFVKPAKNWFYLLAHCNLDGNGALDSYYFSSSENPAVLKLNPGR